MVAEDGTTLGGGHTMQYTDLISRKCMPGTYDPINQCYPNELSFLKKEYY